MKKLALIVLTSIFALSSAFAAVDFSGELKAGYIFNYDNEDNNKWETGIMGQDGDDTNTTKLNLKVNDDEGLWAITIEGTPTLDDSGAVSGDLSLDLAKLFFDESDWSVKLGFNVNDEATGLRAYRRISGNNYDRVRTNGNGLWTSLSVGYGDLVTVQAAGSPKTVLADDTNDIPANDGDFIISALVTPVKGLKVSADWALGGRGNGDSEMKKIGRDGVKYNVGGNGILGVAFDLDLGSLLDTDFSLGLTASERYAFGTDASSNGLATKGYNTLAVGVYGGYGIIDLGLEYALHSLMPEVGDATMINFIYGSLGLSLIEDMGLNLYVGVNDLAELKDTFFLGGTIDYTYRGVTFAVNVDYARPEGTYSESIVNDRTGFSISPSVKVSF